MAHANRSYFILGGISGTEPGIDIPFGPHLPLNWDLFTDLVLAQANNPVLANFKGTLDATGTGTAQFDTVGVMPGGLAGVVFSFAYLVYDPGTSTIFYASNGAKVEVIP